MARRTIQSPGVEIRESDLSLRTVSQGTTTYVTGFANEGPTDEVVGLSNISDFEQIYGQPRSPAERYFYHTVKASLNSTGSVLVNRLPYGGNEGGGEGFGSKLSVLAYPAVGFTPSSEAGEVTTTYTATSDIPFDTTTREAILAIPVSQINSPLDVTYPTGITIGDVLTEDAYTALIANVGATFDDELGDPAVVTTLAFDTPVVNQQILAPLDTVYPTGITIGDELTEAARNTLVDALPTYNDGVGNTSVDTTTAFTSDSVTSPALSASVDYEDEGTWLIGKPKQFELTRDQYLKLKNGELFSEGWTSTPAADQSDWSEVAALSSAAMLVVNKGQTIIDGQFNGYYIGISDNTNLNPARDYDSIRQVETVTLETPDSGLSNFTTIPQTRLEFALSATSGEGDNPATNSVSQVMEDRITNYNISTDEYNDTINVGVFKLRQSVFAKSANTLDYLLEEGINGALGYYRQRLPENGGPAENFFLETQEDASRNIDVIVNPYLSDQIQGLQLNTDGTPKKRIRVITQSLLDSMEAGDITDSTVGVLSSRVEEAKALVGTADSLFAIGAYSETALGKKEIGSLPTKIDRALLRIKNDDKFNIDIIAEGGLGTIQAYMTTAGALTAQGFDDTRTTDGIEALRTSNDLTVTGARDGYMAIYDKFNTFCGPAKDGGRGDVLFVADPIRQLLVSGKGSKIQDDINKNFYTDIYWGLRHQFELANSSYACTYANYMKVYDDYTGLFIYVPPSGFAAAKMMSTDASTGPWGAPAGFNRGVVGGAVDVAISPNQRQRDDLYTVNLNPIATFPDRGNVFFGQKTLLKKPSAFDRINVRRTFLYLEKITKKTMQNFLFENNTLFTRTRVINTLTPFFDRVKVADGLYDYLIVCDERNNTPEVIDGNEMIVDIYLKPVRSAEFILVNFYATRTDANFEELIPS